MTHRTGPSRANNQAQRSPRGRSGGPRQGSASAGRTAVRRPADFQAAIDRYLELARAAESAGDKVLSENYYQHAEHFFRMAQGETA
jgi:hypothetical protein